MTASPAQDRNIRFRTLLRSWIVGGLATIPHLVALIILVYLFHVNDRLANPPALIIGLTIQFFGNKYFAFEDHSPRLLHQGSLFLLVEVGAFLLNLGIYDFLVAFWQINCIAAMLIGTFVVYQGFSFPLWGYIFKRTVEEPQEAAKTADELTPSLEAAAVVEQDPEPVQAAPRIDPIAGALEEA
jgi:putative flippase GtrA